MTETIDWDAYVSTLNSAPDCGSAFDVFSCTLAELGVSWLLYASSPNLEKGRDNGKLRIHTNFDSEWMSRYFERQYYRDDYWLAHCLRHVTPCIWNAPAERRLHDPRWERIKGEAREVGLVAGITCPLRTNPLLPPVVASCGLDVAPNEVAPLLASYGQSIQLAGIYFHAAVDALPDSLSTTDPESILSKRQREVLTFVHRHMRTKVIADRLGLSEHTINLHVRECMRKLQAGSRFEAAAKAVRMNLIAP